MDFSTTADEGQAGRDAGVVGMREWSGFYLQRDIGRSLLSAAMLIS